MFNAEGTGEIDGDGIPIDGLADPGNRMIVTGDGKEKIGLEQIRGVHFVFGDWMDEVLTLPIHGASVQLWSRQMLGGSWQE